jgi:hypothetical protein
MLHSKTQINTKQTLSGENAEYVSAKLGVKHSFKR